MKTDMNTQNYNDRQERGSGEEDHLLAIFKIGEALFGIDAKLVQEVVTVGEITHVHQAPPHVIGIRNLRGRIVTVVDLAIRLGLGYIKEGPESRLLIMEWQGEPVGFMVDAVLEAISIHGRSITTPPANLNDAQRRFTSGIYQEGGRLVGVLEPETFFSIDEDTDTALSKKGEGS